MAGWELPLSRPRSRIEGFGRENYIYKDVEVSFVKARVTDVQQMDMFGATQNFGGVSLTLEGIAKQTANTV